jgi:hypothetical protein
LLPKVKHLIFVVLILAPSIMFGQGACIPGVAITARLGFNNLAQLMPQAQITVSPGPVYTDQTDSTVVTQPVIADSYGNYNLCAIQGSTQIVTVTGANANTISYKLTFPSTIIGATTSANNTFTGSNTFTGNQLFTGATTICNSNTVPYVGGICAATWGNGDIGSQINNAYSGCLSVGCRIHILGSTTCYTQTTPILFTTSGKAPILEGDSGVSCLNYTPTTGIAITLDYGQGDTAAGLRDFTMKGPGPGTSAVAVALGPTNGAINSKISGIRIGSGFGAGDGFGVGYNIYSLGFLSSLENVTISNSGTAITEPNGVVENISIARFIIDHNTIGISLNPSGGFSDIHLTQGSFDDNNLAISVGGGGANPLPAVYCADCHFENGTINSASNPYIALNGGRFYCTQCDMTEDRISGTGATQFITAAGNSYLSLISTNVLSGGATVNEVVNFTGNARGVIETTNTSVAITQTYVTTSTAPVFDLSTWGINANPLAAGNTGLQGQYLLGVATTVSGLPTASGNPGQIRYVTDSTAVAAEGQTCVGSSSTKALAFSNGTVWKCF